MAKYDPNTDTYISSILELDPLPPIPEEIIRETPFTTQYLQGYPLPDDVTITVHKHTPLNKKATINIHQFTKNYGVTPPNIQEYTISEYAIMYGVIGHQSIPKYFYIKLQHPQTRMELNLYIPYTRKIPV